MSKIEAPIDTAIPVTPLTMLQVGNVYRAKHPRLTLSGHVDDRELVYVGLSVVQFASPTYGRNLPYISIPDFMEWVGHDVTALHEGRDDWHEASDLTAWRKRHQVNYEQAA